MLEFLRNLLGDRPLPSWAASIGRGGYAKLIEIVSSELERRDLAHQLADDTIVLQRRGERVQLAEIVEICADVPMREWNDRVRELLDDVLRAGEEWDALEARARRFDDVRDLLRVQLAAEAPDGVHRVLAPGLIAALVFDGERRTWLVRDDQAARWARDDLFDVALANVRERESIERDQLGAWEALRGSVYACALAMTLSDHVDCPHGALIAVPDRRTVLFRALDHFGVVQSVQNLVEDAVRAWEGSDEPVSRNLYWWRAGRFKPLRTAMRGDVVDFHPGPEFEREVLFPLVHAAASEGLE